MIVGRSCPIHTPVKMRWYFCVSASITLYASSRSVERGHHAGRDAATVVVGDALVRVVADALGDVEQRLEIGVHQVRVEMITAFACPLIERAVVEVDLVIRSAAQRQVVRARDDVDILLGFAQQTTQANAVV
ncbi:MAG TPA: hypothetical protein VJZ00_11215 [Thermoanaerobaculia bacterium]|nr:hypothetical protein [Thermoanaerobaculia bacterium]